MGPRSSVRAFCYFVPAVLGAFHLIGIKLQMEGDYILYGEYLNKYVSCGKGGGSKTFLVEMSNASTVPPNGICL